MVGRALGWGLSGALCGLLLGLANGVIHVPPKIPGAPLAHEWYTVGVILIMFLESVTGALIGAGVAAFVRGPSRRVKALAFAACGATLGCGLGWVLARFFHIVLIDWNDGSELMSDIFVQVLGAVGGIRLALGRFELAPRPGDEGEGTHGGPSPTSAKA